MIHCEKVGFGRVFRSLSSNGGAVVLKGSINPTLAGLRSLRPVRPGWPPQQP